MQSLGKLGQQRRCEVREKAFVSFDGIDRGTCGEQRFGESS
jgi:hypothetical protein